MGEGRVLGTGKERIIIMEKKKRKYKNNSYITQDIK